MEREGSFQRGTFFLVLLFSVLLSPSYPATKQDTDVPCVLEKAPGYSLDGLENYPHVPFHHPRHAVMLMIDMLCT